VLADRLAVKFLDHQPGWRLPRRSELARRFQATTAQIDAAIAQLAGRDIVRETADGQFYRASPAESLITLDGLPCLGSRIDPMGTALTCAGRSVLRRDVPEEITRALRLAPGSAACAVQSTWAVDGTIAALSTTYLPASLAAVLVPANHGSAGAGAALNPVPLPRTAAGPAASPAALCLEVQSPPRWAARLLRLDPAEPAITVTVRFDDQGGTPLALTVAVLHAARFRITVETPDGPLAAAPRAGAAAAARGPAELPFPYGVPGGEAGTEADPDGSEDPRWLDVNGVSLDLDGYRVFADGTEIALARKEYDLLRALVENAGRVLTRRDLLDVVWRPGYADGSKTLDVHIRRLRRKLDPGSAVPRIRTIRGIGYVFDVAPAPALAPATS
jgi:DNA-binding GntR family transcriptional regulator